MKTIRRFSNSAEAGFAQSLLESVGIQAALADENAYTLGPQLVPWGIRLQVPESDEQRALEILEQHSEFVPLPEDFVPPEFMGAETPRLAKSQSTVFGAFVSGGLWGLGVVGALSLIAIASGAQVQANAGGILLLFIIGGIIGLIVREIYNKGRRDAATHD